MAHINLCPEAYKPQEPSPARGADGLARLDAWSVSGGCSGPAVNNLLALNSFCFTLNNSLFMRTYKFS